MLTKKQTATLLKVLASASATAVGFHPGGVGATIVAGIGVNLTSAIIQAGSAQLEERWLSSEWGMLNHDIQRALARAFVKALSHLESAYFTLGEADALPQDEKASIRKLFEELKEQARQFFVASLEQAVKEQDIRDYLYASRETATNRLWERIAGEEHLITYNKHFREFLRDNLLGQVELWFGEELKTDSAECNKAWRAFQRLLLEGIQADIKAAKAVQDEVSRDMQKLDVIARRLDDLQDATDHRLPDEPFQAELEQAFSAIQVRLATISETTRRVNDTTQLIAKSVDAVAADIKKLLPEEGERKIKSESRKKLDLAVERSREGKCSEAIAAMKEALACARTEHDEEQEVEILAGLALLTSERRGQGDRTEYLQQAERKIDRVTSATVRVIYLRARAAALDEQRDMAGAEEAYRAALDCCCNEPDDEKKNLATQACIVRSSFAHFLCNQKRVDEARPLLAECERYARENQDAADGELLQAALGAGVHLMLEAGDEEGAKMRITELERFATTSQRAHRIADDLVRAANHASHRGAHQTALTAAEASIRLGQRYRESLASYLLGALYTEAMVIGQAGDREKALCKAQALIDACTREEDSVIRHATQHLIAELQRCLGDSQSAVDLARQALSGARGRPEDIGFTKLALARALNDNGETEEALRHAKEGWILARPAGVPAAAAIDFLSHITNYASQLGAEADAIEALTELSALPDTDEETKTSKERAFLRARANTQLRDRFIGVLGEDRPAAAAGTEGCASLQEANALVVRPLLRLWDEVPECIAGCYDFWGRGSFGRLLLNSRRFPGSFNVTIEVRSLDDIKRSVRLWGLYCDLLILLWKGPTENGLAIVPFPEDYSEAGGWGYAVCAGDVIQMEGSTKQWYPAIGYISALPSDVVHFLASEARPFVASGRLIVVPAVGAGCINPGHGPFEQLLAEAANAVPSMRWKGFEGTPIGLMPYSPDAPLAVLADLADTEAERLRKLRLLLLRRSRELKPDGRVSTEAKMLSMEIDDALRDIEGRSDRLARRSGFSRVNEPIGGATARFALSGKRLSGDDAESPFAPLLILRNHGYGWRVDGPDILRLPARFEPQEGDVVGAWLAPPSSGWTYPAVFKGS